MAASLRSRFNEEVEIKPGKSGQFDVLVDGRVIFSKTTIGRFPIEREVEEILAKLHGKV